MFGAQSAIGRDLEIGAQPGIRPQFLCSFQASTYDHIELMELIRDFGKDTLRSA